MLVRSLHAYMFVDPVDLESLVFTVSSSPLALTLFLPSLLQDFLVPEGRTLLIDRGSVAGSVFTFFLWYHVEYLSTVERCSV